MTNREKNIFKYSYETDTLLDVKYSAYLELQCSVNFVRPMADIVRP